MICKTPRFNSYKINEFCYESCNNLARFVGGIDLSKTEARKREHYPVPKEYEEYFELSKYDQILMISSLISNFGI